MAYTMTVREPAYTGTARALHWLTAVLVIMAIIAGIAMGYAPEGPVQDTLFDVHRSIGAVLIPIIFFRFFYRLSHKPLPLPDDIPAIQRHAAHAVHWTIYALLLVQPIIGWIATSAYRAPIFVFWLFELPPIWPEDRAFSDKLFYVHGWIGYILTILVSGHFAAAMYHHFVLKDGVLQRMLDR